jgi:NAD-dependent deacetylase
MMQKCFELLKHAPDFTVLTGAGVSTLSGISDFRGKDGFYTKGDLLYGVKREDLFDLDFFKAHPEIFYRYAADFLYPMLQKTPSIAHTTLAALQQKKLCGTIFTQNIDTLHSKAGAPDVVELHGTMGGHYCTGCGTEYALSEVLPAGEKGEVPLCKSCSGVIKPKVVFFKETLSTGWDCPRAETMMSFRRAVDYTYIAQLLGRMIRTPLQQRVMVDETLNEVHLYLPCLHLQPYQQY